jgi:hypothetical protein
MGNLCINPLVGANNFVAEPFIITTKETKEIQPIIYFTTYKLHPMCIITSPRYIQLALSHALEKSNLMTNAGIIFVLIVCKPS